MSAGILDSFMRTTSDFLTDIAAEETAGLEQEDQDQDAKDDGVGERGSWI